MTEIVVGIGVVVFKADCSLELTNGIIIQSELIIDSSEVDVLRGIVGI